MRAVWRHDVFMTRVIHEKNNIDTLYTLRTSRSSGDAVLTNEKLPRVASHDVAKSSIDDKHRLGVNKGLYLGQVSSQVSAVCLSLT